MTLLYKAENVLRNGKGHLGNIDEIHTKQLSQRKLNFLLSNALGKVQRTKSRAN